MSILDHKPPENPIPDSVVRQPVRVAFRKEGSTVVAYLADVDTMVDARVLGSLDLMLATDARIWPKWRDLMLEVMTICVARAVGISEDDVTTVEQRVEER